MTPPRLHTLPLFLAVVGHLATGAPIAAQGTPPAVPSLEMVTRIGCTECAGPTQLGTILDVAVTDSGDIVVVDRSAPMIRAFDRAGRVLWTGGRTGGGPGEYRFPMRVALGPDRGVNVVDMSARRMTRLGPDGAVKATQPILAFPAAAGARGRSGELILLMDDFRGPFALERWAPGADKTVPHATIPRIASSGSGIVQPSIAVAPSGVLAFGTDPFTYRIGRLTPDGKPMPEIVRDLPRARRTDAEMQELANRLAMGPERRGAERSVSKAPVSSAPGSPDLSMKPYYPIDGLRYDDGGRLWVLTTRGGMQQTVFDIFAPTGTFLGSTTIPAQVGTFALAGSWLVTGGEDADGYPRVMLWRVRN